VSRPVNRSAWMPKPCAAGAAADSRPDLEGAAFAQDLFPPVGEAFGQQGPSARNDVKILSQEPDLAVLYDEMADVVPRVDPVRAIDDAFGVVFDEKSEPVLQARGLGWREKTRFGTLPPAAQSFGPNSATFIIRLCGWTATSLGERRVSMVSPSDIRELAWRKKLLSSASGCEYR
jgi:hypothetical protein